MDTAALPSRAAVYPMLMLLLVLSGLDQTVLSTALPGIAATLHGATLAPWVFTAYLLASTSVIPLYGKLADRWGVRPMLLTASGLFVLGSLACALADTMPALVAARGLQGTGGGGLLTLTMLACASLYRPEERGRRMAGLGAAYGLSTLVGPLAGGLLLTWLSWHWVFLVNVPLAALAWWTLRRAAFGRPAGAAPQGPLDWPGALLLAGALVALLLATRSDGLAIGSLGQLGRWALAAIGVKLLLLWLLAERRAADPLLPLALFTRPAFAAASALAALTGVNLFAAVVFLPLYLQRGLGFTPLVSAAHTFGLMLGVTLGSQVAGRVLRAGLPARRLAAAAAVSMTVGWALLAGLLLQAHDRAWALGLALLPVGTGLGLTFPLITLVSQRSAAAAQVGVATAVPVMLRALGGATGVAVLGEQLARHMATATPTLTSAAAATLALADGVARLCLICIGVSLLALLVTLRLPGSSRRAGAGAAPAPATAGG